MLLAEKIASKLCGQPCWQARLERTHAGEACLCFEFGRPHLDINEKTRHPGSTGRRGIALHGEWRLEIHAPWEIISDGMRPVHSGSGHKKIDAAAKVLDGQAISEIRINPYSAETLFIFEMGERLSTMQPIQSRQSPSIPWMLHDPLGNVLAVRDDGRFCYQRADAPPESGKWYTLQPNT